MRRALQALVEYTDPVYELIVVDDDSPGDLVASLRREVHNATIVVNDRNLGFGTTNNRAASLARAPYLVFLNSDAFVHDGWLPPMLSVMDDPLVGAVGPRLLNEDGTVQEAGCAVFGNGFTQFVGFGSPPSDAAVMFPREVDYASAACLLVRRSAFEAIGGFDAAYSPAYFEDVDLCLALRRRGFSVRYEPRSVVSHLRGASTSESDALRRWETSLGAFRRLHEVFLRSRPAWVEKSDPCFAARLAASRDALAVARVLAVAGPTGPAAVDGSPSWFLEGLESLARRRRFTRTTLLLPNGVGSRGAEEWLSAGVEVVESSDCRGWISSRPCHYDLVLLENRMTASVEEAVRRSQPQAVLLDPVVLPFGRLRATTGASDAAVWDSLLAGFGIPPEPA